MKHGLDTARAAAAQDEVKCPRLSWRLINWPRPFKVSNCPESVCLLILGRKCFAIIPGRVGNARGWRDHWRLFKLEQHEDMLACLALSKEEGERVCTLHLVML